MHIITVRIDARVRAQNRLQPGIMGLSGIVALGLFDQPPQRTIDSVINCSLEWVAIYIVLPS